MISLGPRSTPPPARPVQSLRSLKATGNVSDQPWFYRREEDGGAIVERLKQTSCPHCHTVGMLIRHGTLSGFDDRNPPRRAIRTRRTCCSNRHRRRGCGRTVSAWLANTIRRLSLTTRTLGAFLQRAVAGTVAAVDASNGPRSNRTFQRIWRRFDRGQGAIRTALLSRGPPPTLPADSARRPAAAHVRAHLRATFPHDCPILGASIPSRGAPGTSGPKCSSENSDFAWRFGALRRLVATRNSDPKI
jgi:hypothetical protein